MSLTGAKGDGGGDRSGGVEGRGGHGKDGVGTMQGRGKGERREIRVK